MYYTRDLKSHPAQQLTLFNDNDILYFYESLEMLGERYYRVPRYFFPHDGVRDFRHAGKKVNIKLKDGFKPRDESQKEAVDALIKNDHGLLSARVGFGKTYIAVDAICRMQVKALIIVNKLPLVKQWEEKIKEYTNIEEVGIIQGKNKDFDKPICISTVQTLSRRVKANDTEFLKEMYSAGFGITFYDECHITAAAPTFSTSVKAVYSKKLFGLSATPYRSDGLSKLLDWYIGPLIFDETKIDMPVIVGLVDIPLAVNPGYKKYIEWSNNNGMIQRYCKFLKKQDFYIEQTAKIIDQMIDNGKQVLALGAIIDILYLVYDKCKNKDKISIIHSSVEDKDYDKQCIIGTYGIFKEGMDIPRLDTLIFLTPLTGKTGLMQSIGRITRKTYKNKKAMVIDIVNSAYEPIKNMRFYRLNHYKKFGFKCVNIENNNQINKFIEYVKNMED
jgi:superfamily II DNA or RNA helicase